MIFACLPIQLGLDLIQDFRDSLAHHFPAVPKLATSCGEQLSGTSGTEEIPSLPDAILRQVAR
jgi:hypothetical protein